jgi:hypothetical protein
MVGSSSCGKSAPCPRITLLEAIGDLHRFDPRTPRTDVGKPLSPAAVGDNVLSVWHKRPPSPVNSIGASPSSEPWVHVDSVSIWQCPISPSDTISCWVVQNHLPN